MFYYISGNVSFKGENFAVIDAGGVGYKIYTSANTLSKLDSGFAKLYTYVHVREDIFDIFGFSSLEELKYFELLISVSGVGPKAALAILSVLSPKELVLAVVTGDVKAISRSQGVGSKISQRIIVELKDKLQDSDTAEILSSGIVSASSSKKENSEAVDALVALGYSGGEANRAVSAVPADITDVEQIIKEALKVLMRG